MFCACLTLLTSSVAVGANLMVLIMIARHPSAIAIRKVWGEKKLITCRSWKLHWWI